MVLAQGFIAKPESLPDGTTNLMIWKNEHVEEVDQKSSSNHVEISE